MVRVTCESVVHQTSNKHYLCASRELSTIPFSENVERLPSYTDTDYIRCAGNGFFLAGKLNLVVQNVWL